VTRGVYWLLAAPLLFALTAHAAITLDATSQGFSTSGTTLTFSHTLGVGANRLVVCGVQIANPTAAVANVTPTVTVGGYAMTAIAASQAPTTSQTSTSKIETEMFYVNDSSLGTTSGSVTVSVTLPSAPSAGFAAACSSYFGAAQAAQEAAGAAYNGSGTAQTIALTTLSSGDLIVDSFAGGFTANGSGKSATVDSGQTQLLNAQNAVGILSASSYEIAGAAGSVSVGWTDVVSRLAYSAVAFAPATVASYTVTATASPSNGGTVALSPSQTYYPSGTSVKVTATPATNYVFTGFSGGLTGTTNPQTFSVTGNTSITANFTVGTCTLTINQSGSGGSVTPSSGSTYPCGTQVQVTATPNSGWTFLGYSGGLTGSTAQQTITMNGNQTVTATFIQGTVCNLYTSVTGNGSITESPTGSGTAYSCGTQVQLTAVPTDGRYSLTSWGGALSGTTNPQTITLSADTTVSATFAQTAWPVNVTIVGGGTVTPSPNQTYYTTGTQLTLTATPNTGNYFGGFTGDQTSSTSPLTFTVNGTTNITATFITPSITLDATSHGASSASASTLSWTHTLGAGTNRAVVIAVGEADSVASPDQYATVTSVTLGGVYATPLPNSVTYGGTSGMVQTQLFYILDSELPAAGTYTVQVNLAGSIAGISAGAISMFGVNQGPPEAVATNKNTAGANTLSSTITTLSNNAWVIDLIEDGDVAALTASSGQTQAWQAEAKTGTGASSYKQVATAGSASMGWTGTANRLAASLLDFAPSLGATPTTYTLTTSVGTGSGTVSANPNLSSYVTGTGVLLTATPSTGYTFSSWSGDYTSTTNPLPISMTGNLNVVANFTTAAVCTVNITIVGSGTLNIANGATYNCGTVLQFTATPGTGYAFTSYTGDLSTTDNPTYFTLSSNANITVEFDPVPQCTLTMATSGTGTVLPGTSTYACGAAVQISATAGSGYVFTGWSGGDTTTNNPDTITLNSSETVTANFSQGSTCTLTTSVTGNGTITPASGSAYLCGSTISISAVAGNNYLFTSWGGALSGSNNPTTLTMSTNETVSATFTYNTTGVTGDTRTVTQPVYPPVCTVLTAAQILTSPNESLPDTTRVQSALNACPSGQAVEFSADTTGTYNAFIIAPITLPAGVTMLVDPEVTILGSIKYADYTCVSSQSWCNPLINIAPNTYPSPGSAIMGLGVIDGRGGTTLTDKGESWWKTGSDTRPRLVYLGNRATGAFSDNFTAYQITLKNSPKFHLSGWGNDWTVWGIRIYAPPDSPNTDGIDPSGSSNVTIVHNWISDGDDHISPKGDTAHLANLTIAYNNLYSGHGISVGSETYTGLNNMYVHDINIDNGFGGTSFNSLRIKSGATEGGEVYDVLYKNICINNGGDTIVIDPYYKSGTGTLYPNFHDITFQNLHQLIHSSSYKPTIAGYNTSGVVYPTTVTMDNVIFDGAIANDVQAPKSFNNAQFTLGPGPVTWVNFLTTAAATASNYITVTNNISNSNAPLDCSNAFTYLSGDLYAKTATATAGGSFKLTAVLQNVVSPVEAGTLTYAQNNAPTGTVQILEGTNVVGTGTLSGRLAYITLNSLTYGSHTYTANYLGDTHYTKAFPFGTFTLTVNYAAPVATSQTVNVSYNTATPITLGATGSGTITYTVLSQPTNGALSGSAPNLTYTPTTGYTGTDSFTFKANNGSDSNTATVNITVLGAGGGTSQSITFTQPASPVAYGASTVTLSATATSGLTVSYGVNGPGSLSGNTLKFTGAGTVTVTASQNGGGGYAAATPVSYNIVVNPAVLTVALSGSPSRAFGTPNPAFAYTLSGFVGTDSQSNSTTGTPTITTTATQNSPAGSYPVTVAAGTLAATNYTFAATSGTLVVTGGASHKIDFPPLPSLPNGAVVTLVAQASSGLPVTFAVTSGPATVSGNTLTITGTGSITVTATQAGNSNFAAATSVSRTFTSY